MTAQHKLLTVAEDDLWSVADVARHLRLKPKTVRESVVCRPNFPKPICPTGSPRIRRWKPDEVRRWCDLCRAA